MANTFDWVEIRTHDIQATAKFYETLFGWKIIEEETAGGSDVWVFDVCGEPRVENLRRGGIWLRPNGEPPGIVVYVFVEDIESILDRIKELGGIVVNANTPLGAGYAACLTDPSGNLLGLYQEKSVRSVKNE